MEVFEIGEGWNNYNKVFNWEYKNDEIGKYSEKLKNDLIDLL